MAFGALATTGQRCTSTRRLIAQEGIYRDLVDRLAAVYRSVRVGNPLEPGVLVGPLVSRDAVEDYLAAVAQAQEQGGRLLCGGKTTRYAR